MRRVFALLLLNVVLVVPACSDAKPPAVDSERVANEANVTRKAVSDEPRVYESPNGRFRVRFAGEPRVSDRPASPKDGTTGEDSYALIRLPRRYVITCTRIADSRDPQQEIARLVKDSQGGGSDLKVLESKDVPLKDRPGRDTLCKTDDDRLVRERFFVDGKDSYHLIAIVPNTEEDAKAAGDFVESFEFLKD